MKFRLLLAAAIAAICTVTVAYAVAFSHVTPSKYDPKHTSLVASLWVNGIGCPTGATVTYDGINKTTYSDPACLTGDSGDTHNQGLLMAKTGPTGNYAAAQARLTPVPSQVLELGYDIRKPTSSLDPRGSHCGGGAPRFDIVTKSSGIYFLGCNSADATQTNSNAWTRLRWGSSATTYPQNGGATQTLGSLQIAQVWIIFDEGQDASGGPDMFGLAVLDNIDVNGTLVGHSG